MLSHHEQEECGQQVLLLLSNLPFTIIVTQLRIQSSNPVDNPFPVYGLLHIIRYPFMLIIRVGINVAAIVSTKHIFKSIPGIRRNNASAIIL